MKLREFAKAVNNGDQVTVDAWFYAILTCLAAIGAVQVMEEFRIRRANYRSARRSDLERAVRVAVWDVECQKRNEAEMSAVKTSKGTENA